MALVYDSGLNCEGLRLPTGSFQISVVICETDAARSLERYRDTGFTGKMLHGKDLDPALDLWACSEVPWAHGFQFARSEPRGQSGSSHLDRVFPVWAVENLRSGSTSFSSLSIQMAFNLSNLRRDRRMRSISVP